MADGIKVDRGSRVIVKGRGPALVVERLSDSTWIIAYVAGGLLRETVIEEHAFEYEMDYPAQLEALEELLRVRSTLRTEAYEGGSREAL